MAVQMATTITAPIILAIISPSIIRCWCFAYQWEALQEPEGHWSSAT